MKENENETREKKGWKADHFTDAGFVSRLWQIYIFCEGNTRATAVFFIKYLRSMGFNVTNDVSFLELFLRNLLLGEKNELKNRYMHIRWDETTHSKDKRHIERHIPDENHILKRLEAEAVSSRTKTNILKLYDSFGKERIFGRGDVVDVLGITEKPASTLLGKMYKLKLTEKITGAGKGKYRFI